ncbi:MAG: rhodanese-like domain-containing protein [Thermoplasmatota archaeon]
MKRLRIFLMVTILLILPFSSGSIIAFSNKIETSNTCIFTLNSAQGYTNITVGDAWNMTQSLSNGEQIPIDVRRDDEWIVEHIHTPFPQHAQHWPNLQEGQQLTAFLEAYKDKEVIIYCRTGVRSYNAVKLLIANGFNGIIYHMLGGIVEWKSQQLPTKPNNAPETPTITGPSNGKVGITYEYILTTFDSDYGDVYYHIDWGPFSGNEEIGPFSSMDEAIATNTWPKQGTYEIKVKAIDRYYTESDWAILSVVMPISQNIAILQFWQQLMMRFPNLCQMVRCLLGLI